MKKNKFRKEKRPITANTVAKIALAMIALAVCIIAITSNAHISEGKVLDMLREDDPNLLTIEDVHRSIIADTTLVAVSATNDGKLVKTAYRVDSDVNHDYTFEKEVR